MTVPTRQLGTTGRYQAIASGTTTRAPEASPSHHVRQTVGASCQPITSPSRSDAPPTVALKAVPAAIATTNHPTPLTLSSGDPRRTKRRISTVATTTSRTFPQVWPTAEPTGRVM